MLLLSCSHCCPPSAVCCMFEAQLRACLHAVGARCAILALLARARVISTWPGLLPSWPECAALTPSLLKLRDLQVTHPHR
eukprot:4433151-Pyramimonas_sp.AAC.1